MSRPLRIEFEQAVYHVTSRGNERRAIFRDDKDRQRFLDTLAEAIGRFGLLLHGFCLMPNHYHLLLQTPRANLSRAMAWLQTTYSVRFNRRHGRSGHLFQGRFKAQIVEADEYARDLIEYVHLNPVRPRDRRRVIPADRRPALDAWVFSSHRAYAGLGKPPPWLCTQWLSYFGSGRHVAQRRYRQSIAGWFGREMPDPWAAIRGGLVLGSEAFAEKVKSMLRQPAGSASLDWKQPKSQEQLHRAIAAAIAREKDPRVRIWLRVQIGAEAKRAVARDLGYADGSGVLRVVQRLDRAAATDKALLRKLESLRSEMLENVNVKR